MTEKSLNQKVREFVAEKRTSLGMSQTDLSVALFKTKRRQDFISKLESGQRDITLNTLDKILKVFNADITIEEF